jgi:N,N'-diacetyllegionaminate synthase
MKTFIIAEIGSAWRFGDRELRNAHQAIGIAKEAGADAVKFQFTSDPRKMEARRNVQPGAYDILAWPASYIEYFHQVCEEAGIEFMCTVFLPKDVKIIDPYVKRFKVASLESGSNSLANAMADADSEKDIIVSHGASGRVCGHQLLHCTAAYPAPMDSLNLKAIQVDGYEGYSDHSADLLTGALAVACGAEIVEVHFRLSGTPKDNPDYNHSHSPKQLKQYIDNIKKAELMLGDGIKKVEPCEEWALKHKVRT